MPTFLASPLVDPLRLRLHCLVGSRCASRCVTAFVASFVAAISLTSTPRAAAADEGAAALPSTVSFFRNPDIDQAKLSPSGRWLAITSSSANGRAFLGVIDLEAAKASLKTVANFSNTDIHSFSWVNDDRLIFNTVDTLRPGFDQQFGPGLYSVRRDGSEIRMLIRTRYAPPIRADATRIQTQPLDPNHSLLGTIDGGGDDVIVAEYRLSNTREVVAVNPKRLDVVTGRAVSLGSGAPPHVMHWLFDREGNARIAVAVYQGQSEIFWRAPAQEAWASIARYDYTRPTFWPTVVDGQGQLYVSAPGPGGQSVFKRFDFKTGKPEADALVSAPGFDLSPSPILEPESGRLLGIGYHTDAHATAWFDPAYKSLQAIADERFPGRVNELTCRRCLTDGVLLVYSYSDRNPGDYYLYRAGPKSWEAIGSKREGIVPARMAQLDFFRTQARDGEDLPIWVTTPQGSSAKPRAAIVLVHGGPYLRGVEWEWNGQAQFLASRGYVVLEPEFRGSGGYGRKHLEAGFKQWGLKMQDDLVDAVQWATTKGLVDPARVCIVGASYGGYATLMGLVRNPQTYKCGVAWLAVTDPRLLFENSWSNDTSRENQQYSMPTMIGDPVVDAALLKDAAPVNHAREIRAPLLMAFGGNDVRVPLEHGTQMRDAMRAAGQNPEFVVYDGEGHGFFKVDNRVDFWNRVEKFLAKQLQ